MADGYCTVDDVRRVLQETSLSGALSASDHALVVDAIVGVSATIEKATKRHWYSPGGIQEDDEGVVGTAVKSRDDEHDIPTHAGFVHGDSERERYRYRQNSDALLEADPRHERRRELRREPKREIRIATGEYHDGLRSDTPAYTRIRFDRKDVDALNELHVVNDQGGYDEWVGSADYAGGVGTQHRGEDFWVRVNNGGDSELYIDVHALDDDLASLSNAVYVDLDYGTIIDERVRRGTAFLTASELVVDDEFVTSIPDEGQLTNVETKAERWGRMGVQKFARDIEDPEYLEAYSDDLS